MMTPICPWLLTMISDFVLVRFRARAPDDLSAIEVIYLYYYIYTTIYLFSKRDGTTEYKDVIAYLNTFYS